MVYGVNPLSEIQFLFFIVLFTLCIYSFQCVWCKQLSNTAQTRAAKDYLHQLAFAF